MNDTINLTFLLMLSALIFAHANEQYPLCDMSECKGAYRIPFHEVTKLNIGFTNTTIDVTESDTEVSIIYAKRRRLSIYCYDGTWIDPNTGCYESVKTLNPNCNTLREWNSENICPTGIECYPDGDCYAGAAYSGCYDDSTIKDPIGPKSLKWEGTRWQRFPTHTCVGSWECNKIVTKVPLFSKPTEAGEVGWVFYDKDNKEHNYTENTYLTGDTSNLDEKLCLLNSVTEKKVSREDASCYSENIENIKCIITSAGRYKGTVFDISKEGYGALRNMFAKVTGPLLVSQDGRIVDLNEHKTGADEVMPHFVLDRQRAVNVETAHELAITATVLQLQTFYNILSISQELDKIYNVLTLLLKSQSINDPLLISEVLEGARFAVKWDNRQVFSKCPCVQDKEEEESNCMGDRRFNYGSYIKEDDRSKCYHIDRESIENVSVVDKQYVHVDTIKLVNPQTSSSDSAAWDALNDYRNSRVEGDKTSHFYDNMEQKITQIEESIGIGKWKNYIMYASAGAAWVSLAIIVLRR